MRGLAVDALSFGVVINTAEFNIDVLNWDPEFKSRRFEIFVFDTDDARPNKGITEGSCQNVFDKIQ